MKVYLGSSKGLRQRYFGLHFRSNLRKSAHAAVKNRKGKSYVYNKN